MVVVRPLFAYRIGEAMLRFLTILPLACLCRRPSDQRRRPVQEDAAQFKKMFPDDAKVERLAIDFQFIEGPASTS
jgi:hypothetical protein